MSEGCKAHLKALLKKNMEIFAWEPSDTTGVPRWIIEHSLNVNPTVELFCQKRMVLAPDRSQAVTKEVEEWLRAGIVRPVKYPTWISNPVLIGRNLEAYVDDMIIKSNDKKALLADIPETFVNLRRINMKLNPKKCSFGVEEGKLLGYMVMSEGIRANLKKMKAIADMQSPCTLKEISSGGRKRDSTNEKERETVSGTCTGLFPAGRTSRNSTRNVLSCPRQKKEKDDTETWTLFTNGASNRKGSGASLVLISPNGMEFTYALRLNFTRTNNEAEYEALLAGLHKAAKMKVQAISVNVDSKLVASQIIGSYVANRTSVIKYLATTKECIAGFKSFAIQNIPKNLNQKANVLSKLATVAFDHLTKEVSVEVLSEWSMDRKEVSAIVEEEEDNWMTPIIRCLKEGVWPQDKTEAKTLRMKINQYVLEGDSCSDTEAPENIMTSIMAQWGMDILGPLPQSAGKVKFVIVAIDYFTKWIEAKPLAKITEKEVKKFVWDNIVCQFGLPKVIVTDNGTQFVNDPFKSWCEKLNIQQMNTAVSHPQVNDLVEKS
ncbi:reverse transcriptase domain-containing protein [Tanacetum coccineum]|uniref:Reverse transcriptase domain-containing protein n=1 Tax=Tanacetum coccineum TaxID=301880 RepID=A0ABQ5FTE4_9ASTR